MKWVETFPGELFAGVTFFVYLLTLAPGVWGFDSAEFATGVFSLGIVHPTGYPFYIIVAKIFTILFPVGDIAFRLNVLSALFAAATNYCLFHLLNLLIKNRATALIAAGVFAFSNYFWQMALIAEVYTLHTLFLVLCIYLLVRYITSSENRWLYLFAFLYGLSLSNHTSGILFSFGYAWILISHHYFDKKGWIRKTILSGLCFAAGLIPYIYLPLRNLSTLPINYPSQYYDVNLNTLSGIWWMITGRAYRFFIFAYQLAEVPAEIGHYFSFLWRNFFGIGVLIGIAGCYILLKKNWKLTTGLLLIFIANAVFYINYRVADKDTMFLPSFMIVSIFLAYGLYQIVLYAKLLIQRNQLSLNPNIISYALISILPIGALILNWQWVDMSSKNGPQRFASQVFINTPQNSIIFADWSSAVILEYFQVVQGQRPDVIIYNRSRTGVAHFYKNWINGAPYFENMNSILNAEIETINKNIDARSVFVIEYEQNFERAYKYIPYGDYYQLIRR